MILGCLLLLLILNRYEFKTKVSMQVPRPATALAQAFVDDAGPALLRGSDFARCTTARLTS
jgi:hypothetical protein